MARLNLLVPSGSLHHADFGVSRVGLPEIQLPQNNSSVSYTLADLSDRYPTH